MANKGPFHKHHKPTLHPLILPTPPQDYADLVALGQTCRLLYAALQHSDSWRSAVAPLRNSMFVRIGEPGFEFLAPKSGLAAYGARFLPPHVLRVLRRRRTQRVALLGPNLNTEPYHMHALACELPQLEHLVLVRAEVSAPALAQLAANCQRLRSLHLVKLEVRHYHVGVGRKRQARRAAACCSCPTPPHIQSLVAVASIPRLQELVLEDCSPAAQGTLLDYLERDAAQLPCLRRIEFIGAPQQLEHNINRAGGLWRDGRAVAAKAGRHRHNWPRNYALWERRTALKDIADFPTLPGRPAPPALPYRTPARMPSEGIVPSGLKHGGVRWGDMDP
jgi:hypothetical protein